ncbi:unnamed protein product [Cyclocybe aegerita]|uniref:Nephrocystin 3-like N-terminal domain-containing protein n=1 Tax=Cyclocybe aegerita TaxID=1973307 RepID=A0A8S0WS28_CYCAE|nr:unnamed protein product [Cyclocybe aegerita]
MAEFFRGSYNNHIQNSTFNVHTTTHNHHPTEESQGFKILKKAVAPNAFHDSDDRFDPPKCHENTRVAIVNKIIQWVKGETETDSFVLWMSGPAGAGKTAIARKIAEICEAHGLLLASFLFFRPDSRRNTIKPLVANIAYCASRVVPGVRPAIEAIIDTDPHIFSSSLETQLRKLVFEPLRLLYERGQFPPPLIVIDGLDECLDQDSQDNVIQVLSSSMPKYQLPLKFLIVSRPETHIKFSIKVSGQKTRISHLELNDDFCPDDDIRLFLTEKFEEIRTCHPLAPRNSSVWPSEEQMDTLVCKASGQFIYASLLVRFVNFARDSPTRSLDIVLELRPPVHRDLPFAELDALYAFILSGAGPGIDQILKILGVHIALGVDRDRLGKNNIREIRVIEAVLGLEPGDVRVALIGLSSLLDVRYSRLLHGDYQIVFHHSSLQDFLFNRLRAKDYYIDIQPMHQAVAQWPLRTFTLENLSQPAQHIAGCIELAGHLKQLSHSQLIELRRDLEDFSFGPYLENSIEIVAHKIRMNPTSIGEMVQACACMFFDGLQELKQAELHQHHSEQYLSFVVSQIDGRRCPEAFHLMSAVCVDPSAVWRNLCGRLFAFDAWDVSWDVRNHQFLRYPDSKYKDMRAKAGPLAKLYGAAAEMNSEVSLPSRLSRILGGEVQTNTLALETTHTGWFCQTKIQTHTGSITMAVDMLIAPDDSPTTPDIADVGGTNNVHMDS